MDEAFTIDEWLDFVDDTDAFDVRVSGKLSNDRVVIICEDGIEIFNKELYEIALDIMGYNEDWVEEYALELTRHRIAS